MGITDKEISFPDTNTSAPMSVWAKAMAESIDNKIALGMASGQVNAPSIAWVTVNFPPGRFSNPPFVFATHYSDNGTRYIGDANARIRNVTATSFQVYGEDYSSVVEWFAISLDGNGATPPEGFTSKGIPYPTDDSTALFSEWTEDMADFIDSKVFMAAASGEVVLRTRYESTSVPFPDGVFTKTPFVFIHLEYDPQQAPPSAVIYKGDTSTQGTRLVLTSTKPARVFWFAIQMTPTSAAG